MVESSKDTQAAPPNRSLNRYITKKAVDEGTSDKPILGPSPVRHVQKDTKDSAPSSSGTATPPIPTIDKIDIRKIESATSLDGSMIVELRSDVEKVTQKQRDAHMLSIQKLSSGYNAQSEHHYPGIEVKLDALCPSYVGRFHPEVIKVITGQQSASVVKSYTQNEEIEDARVEGISPYWPLSRITMPTSEFADFAKSKPPQWKYNDKYLGNRGKGTTIFVVDSKGFQRNDFKLADGRLQGIFSHTLGDAGTEPSHGTIVTNIACGDTCGVASKADVRIYCPSKSTKVDKYLTMSKIGWDLMEIEKTDPNRHCLLNMSWGWAVPAGTGIVWYGLKRLVDLGIIPIAAAPNDPILMEKGVKDFPINSGFVIGVGATDQQDALAEKSAYGPLIDIYAPGVDISVKQSPKIIRGTSTATPLVAGLVACILSTNSPKKKLSVQEVRDLIKTSYSYPNSKNSYAGHPIPVITAIKQNKEVADAPNPFNILKIVIPDGQNDQFSLTYPGNKTPTFGTKEKVQSVVQALFKRDVPGLQTAVEKTGSNSKADSMVKNITSIQFKTEDSALLKDYFGLQSVVPKGEKVTTTITFDIPQKK
jgi:subtilisin family serine protease